MLMMLVLAGPEEEDEPFSFSHWMDKAGRYAETCRRFLSIGSQAVEAFFCNGSAEEHPDRKDMLSFVFVLLQPLLQVRLGAEQARKTNHLMRLESWKES